MTPLGREQTINLVAESPLPIPLGAPRPSAMVVEQDGCFRIRELVVIGDSVTKVTESMKRARTPSWMPDHHLAMGIPVGTIYAEAASREELLAIMSQMPWPQDW